MIDKSWTEKEVEILKKYYPKGTSMDKILEMLPNRTYPAVLHKASNLGLKKGTYTPEKKKSRRWTKSEINFVRTYYGRMDEKKLAEALPGRSITSIKSLIHKKIKENKKRTVFKRNPPWSDEETKILVENYKKMTTHELTKIIPDRTYYSIRGQLGILGLKRDKKDLRKKQYCRMWTKEEKQILLDNSDKTTKEIRKLLPERSEDAIRGQLRRIRLFPENVFDENE